MELREHGSRRMRKLRRSAPPLIFLLLATGALGHGGSRPLWAQKSLSLTQAIAMALEQNPGLRALEAAEQGAGERLHGAKAGYFPTINYSESVQWGTNPVYVFGSLLEQHRFQASNFDLHSLNRPEALANFSSQLSVEQVLFDGHQTRHRSRSAQLGLEMTQARKRQAQMDLLAAVAQAYFGAVLARENRRVAEETLATAEADLERALARRQAGMTTDADVLSLRVSRAEAHERLIRAENELDLAQARLNNALGAPLATQYHLSSPLRPSAAVRTDLSPLEQRAAAQRPEAAQAQMALALARTERELARAAFLPQVSVVGVWEANRQTFAARGGSNWMTGAMLRWNLFRGAADRARLAETAHLQIQREQEQQQVLSALRLEVREAYLLLQAANRRLDVGEAAVAQAEESHRILANRYEAGLATSTELLRSQTALSEAKTRYLAAVFDQRVAAVRLERAAGTLDPSSEVLQP
ncbi:MAG TPA: TolC family protein [Terriglobia bacterium]|nr:TolC family protein [Terriglobia bacterium]